MAHLKDLTQAEQIELLHARLATIEAVLCEFIPMIEEDSILKNGNKELVPGGVSHDRVTSVSVKAIQELNAKIKALEARLQ